MKNIDCLADLFDPHRPWLMLPDMFESLAARSERFTENAVRLNAKGRDSQFAASQKGAVKTFPRAGATFRGPIDLPGMTVNDDGIAEIPIYGAIGDKLDPLVKWFFDMTDLRDVQSEIQKAESDPDVKAVLFTHDSPGGTSRNTPETAEMIGSMRKPAMSYVDGMCCSADFWMAAATPMIFASRSSDVGSIGAYSAFFDLSDRYREAGVKVQVFGSGTYKGAGYPGTSLTPEQAMLIKADVMEVAQEFKAFIQSRRPLPIPDSAMQGQSFSAQSAMKMGLIDGIMPSKAALLSIM